MTNYLKRACACLIVLILTPCSGSAQALAIYNEAGETGLRFNPEPGYSYKVDSSLDLASWSHLVSLRGQEEIDWPLRASELGQQKLFFRTSKVVATGLDNLTGWSAFQNSETGRFQIGLIGDSYTHNRIRYAKRLKQTLTAQYGNLGAGFLGFGFAGSPPTVFPNGSIDDTELSYVIPYEQWTYQYGNGYGPDACHVTSSVSNASLSIQVLRSVDSIKLFFANDPGTGGFHYRVAGGSWTTVSTDAPLGFDIELIDVSGLSAPYNIELETLDSGVTLIGAEAIKTGQGVVVHKLGATGKAAINFANNPVAKESLVELNLDMVIIMFGTNEQGGGHIQSVIWFKSALSNIISSLRAGNPSIDVVLMLPCYTKYELEDPKTYKLQDYGQAMREVALERHAAFLDLTKVFGPATELQNLIDSGLMHTDRIHPTTTGVGSGGYLIADTVSRSVLAVP